MRLQVKKFNIDIFTHALQTSLTSSAESTVCHKFYLVHSWILCLILTVYSKQNLHIAVDILKFEQVFVAGLPS